MAKNVIIMVGDGMGWEMARAAAIQKQINEGATGNTLSDFYTEGTGTGLSFQELEGYTISTTSNTYIDGSKGNSALQGSPFDHNTGESEPREGFEFDPSAAIVQGFVPDEEGNTSYDESPIVDANGNPLGGNVPIYDTELGGDLPWLNGTDPEYIKNLYPDSAGTATSLYTGTKTYVGAIGVDIHEHDVMTMAEQAMADGKSAGVVSSVPFNHATPAAAVAHVNNRNKTHDESFEQRRGDDEEFRDENGNLVDEFGHPIEDYDNILSQIVEEVKPTLVLGAGHADTRGGDERYITYEQLEELRNSEDYTFLERGENAAQVLADTAAGLNVDEGDRLFGIYGAKGQGGNLPWRTADGDYSNAGLSGRRSTERPLEEGQTDEEFIAQEVNYNPNLNDMTSAALDVLGDDEEGFWLMIESGDIDWAAHDNSLDNMVGATMDFQDSVQTVMDWIEVNGGWEENQLIVTADHDHYFTLNPDYPELLRTQGAEAMTAAEDTASAGHYWGSDSEVKYGWGTHTTRPVPVYYQGADTELFEKLEGEGYEVDGKQVEGVEGFIDQVHIGQVQEAAFAFDTPIKESENGDNYLDFSGFQGNVEVDYTISREAAFDNNVYFYSVDEVTGTIGGVEAGAQGYLEAALANIITPSFSTTDNNEETGSFMMEAGSIIGTLIIADGSLTDAENGSATVYFSFGMGSDNFDHIKKDGNNTFMYEDQVGGGDMDFDDTIIKFDDFAVV